MGDEEEETESDLSTQLREAKEKISALEDKLKAQEILLKEAEEKRVFSSEHTRSSGQVINDLEPQNIAVKRPAATAAEEEAASMKKVRASSDQKFGQGEEKGTSAETKHPETALTNSQPSASATPAAHHITKQSSTTPPKDSLENTASSKSTATALPSVSASGAEATGQQLTVAEMLADFKDKLSDNLLRMGNPSHVNAALQD